MTVPPSRSGYFPDEEPQPDLTGSKVISYSFTPEELRVLTECEKDSLKYRSLPLMIASGLGVHLAIKKGVLKQNPVLGPYPKLGVAITFSYLIGRFSYVSECAERIMRLPNSPLADELKRKRGQITNSESRAGHGRLDHYQRTDTVTGFVPVQNQQLFEHGEPSAQQSEFSDFASQAPARPEQAPRKSFEELRNENRLQYAQNMYSRKAEPSVTPNSYNRQIADPIVKTSSTSRPDTFPPAEVSDESQTHQSTASFQPLTGNGKRNAYGDRWEE